jgi:ABC-type uncharacterized transport system permease subunit
VVVRLGAQGVDGPADLRRGVAAPAQVGGEQPFLNVAVAVAVGPVAQVAVAQLIAEERDDTLLCGSLGLAYNAHGLTSFWFAECVPRLYCAIKRPANSV